jgi:hypothetical protein
MHISSSPTSLLLRPLALAAFLLPALAASAAQAVPPGAQASLSLGLGAASWLLAGATMLIALGCFGGCVIWATLLPALATLGAAVAAVLFGGRALAGLRKAPKRGKRWQAIAGIALGLPIAGLALYFVYASLR